MVLFKYPQLFQKSEDAVFDQLWSPGAKPAHSGIYRCEVCGREVVGENERHLPPQNHHQHDSNQPIKWRLVCW